LDYSKGNKLLVLVGIVSSLISGVVLPTMGLHIARILAFELMYPSDEEYYRSQIQWEYLYMLITCAVTPFVIALQYYAFLSVGCNIVNQMREDIYRKVIRLPLEWFENQ
jgi:ABC-type multidrug transport system fused ATPase/permease subunit